MLSFRCEKCANIKWNIERGEWICPKENDCFSDGKGFNLFVDASEIKAVLDAEWLAITVAHTIYTRSKGKIFNVLESQIDSKQRLDASKKITQDIISGIAKDIADFIKEVLGDWQQTVVAGGELTPEEEAEARKEYEEVERVIR